ncbi:MAG: efflux RND transporter periplasmic adaptor subunit [Kiritimatiellae bacterium]|nr:efflux RND transporter periplasmic adaptor subunit [Kiritimatiellia bacterium]
MKIVVRIFSFLLLAAAVAAVFLYDGGKPKQDDAPLPVRPIKSVVVGATKTLSELHFPGVVDASTGVSLSFEVSGRIVDFPFAHSRGQHVEEGTVLARIDDRDYSNKVANAEAELTYAESNFQRMKAAVAKNAVSKDEYSNSRASAEKARASLAIARKALGDTVLRAPFAGVISDVYVNNFDTVSSSTPILKLQDMTTLDLTVSVPESYVLSAPATVRANFDFEASFDSLPGRTFPVRVKDAARVADSATQTYRATFSLDAPKDIDVLPGMTCTVSAKVPDKNIAKVAEGSLSVPFSAIGAAADTKSFVWRLDDNGNGTYTAHRANVELGDRFGESILIQSGVSAGDRVAVAGVTVLTEGRVVRLTDESAAAK